MKKNISVQKHDTDSEPFKNQLDETEHILTAVLNDTKSGYWCYNVEAKRVTFSSQFLTVLGYEQSALNNDLDTLSRLMLSDKWLKINAILQMEIMANTPSCYDDFILYRKKDGHFLSLPCKGEKVSYNDQESTLFIFNHNIASVENTLPNQELIEALAQRNHRFQTSLNASKIGIWDWDIVDNVLLWDDMMYEIYGVSKEKFGGAYESWQAGVHPDDIEKGEQDIHLALSGNKEFDTEFRIFWRDGTVRHMKGMATVERNNEGQPLRMIGTNWDITKEKEAEYEKLRLRQLESRNEELEQFVYVASHDLNEPLITISSFTHRLQDEYSPLFDKKGSKYLNFITSASEKLTALVYGLLDYSRIGSDLKIEDINILQLVQGKVDGLAKIVQKKEAIIEFDSLPIIKGYKIELEILFHNLISNALKFTKLNNPPVIEIIAEKKNDFWLFSISDNGIGIDDLHKKRIFFLFQKLHNHKEFNGTGIGLSQCKKIVEMHGGEIYFKSELGKGTTFYFTLPEKI
jgi:PAS domain S-box-containing protein